MTTRLQTDTSLLPFLRQTLSRAAARSHLPSVLLAASVLALGGCGGGSSTGIGNANAAVNAEEPEASAPDTGDPTAKAWVYRGVKIHDEDIRQYTWERTVGKGPYDKIAVHRFVREPNNKDAIPNRPAPDKRKVLFGVTGTWGQGGPRQLIEEYDAHFFPKHGYDYWTMDFRTSYVPNLAPHQFEEYGELQGLKSIGNWTYDVFREDIKLAVELAKKISRADKVFMSGRSRGGTQLYMYAAKYSQDLKGMIGLDGGPIYRGVDDPSQQRSKKEFKQALEAFRNGNPENLVSEVSSYGDGQLAGAIPSAEAAYGRELPSANELPYGPPRDGLGIRDITDLAAYDTYYVWGEGMVSNVYGAHPNGGTYMDKDNLVLGRQAYTRYWPEVQNLEASFLAGYADNPYLDYDDTKHVVVPVIHFNSEFSCLNGSCLSSDRPYSVGSDDVTVIYLEGYGHVDVYYGRHAIEDVKKPMLNWMNARL